MKWTKIRERKDVKKNWFGFKDNSEYDYEEQELNLSEIEQLIIRIVRSEIHQILPQEPPKQKAFPKSQKQRKQKAFPKSQKQQKGIANSQSTWRKYLPDCRHRPNMTWTGRSLSGVEPNRRGTNNYHTRCQKCGEISAASLSFKLMQKLGWQTRG